MTEAQKGVLAMVGCSAIWGLSGIYYKALAHVPPLEVLSHRTLWSLVFFAAVLAVQCRGGEVRQAFGQRRNWAVLAISATTIAVNWLGFIYAVQSGQALEASLGYYIFPLVAVVLGYLVLGERFTPLQTAAIGLAAAAVLMLALGLGTPPWIALLVASTFGLYGLVKTQVPLGPVISVCFETMLLAPVAAIWLWGVHELGWPDIGGRSGGAFGDAWATSALLALSGPLTGGPLMLFSYAARRIPYATLGLVQYLNPTLQFAVAVALFGEPVTPWHAAAFPLIWAGLALYSRDSWRQESRSRKRAASAGTES